MPLIGHVRAGFRNAFRSDGARLFGWRFALDYLRFAGRSAMRWGDTGPGTLRVAGFAIPYQNQTHALFLLHEIFVNGTYAFRRRRARPRVIDCGANIGLSVAFFKAYAPDASIVAIEAHPATCAMLRQTIERNAMRDVEVIGAAVASTDGVAVLYAGASDAGSITASLDPAWNSGAPQEVRTIRLSSLLTTRVDFLKLDVEGAEYAVIDEVAASNRLALVDEIIVECHDREPGDTRARAQLVDQLERSGLRVSIAHVDEGARIAIVHGERVD